MKKVSVSLLVYNEKHNLEENISKAYKELEKLNLEFELWVFDNKSSDGTEFLVNLLQKKYNNLKYFQQDKNLGEAVVMVEGGFKKSMECILTQLSTTKQMEWEISFFILQ